DFATAATAPIGMTPLPACISMHCRLGLPPESALNLELVDADELLLQRVRCRSHQQKRPLDLVDIEVGERRGVLYHQCVTFECRAATDGPAPVAQELLEVQRSERGDRRGYLHPLLTAVHQGFPRE